MNLEGDLSPRTNAHLCLTILAPLTIRTCSLPMGCLLVYLLSVSPTATEALAGRDQRVPMSSTRLVLHNGWSKHHTAYTTTSGTPTMAVSEFSTCIHQTGQGPGGTGYVAANCSISGVLSHSVTPEPKNSKPSGHTGERKHKPDPECEVVDRGHPDPACA